MSNNLMKSKERGDLFEKNFSRHFHQTHCPVLVSSLLLREQQAGQIDMAGLQKQVHGMVLVINELKFSQYPTTAQWLRLKKSQDYLSRVLDMEVKLSVKFCQKD